MANSPTGAQNSVCPVTFALSVFGDRWTLLILRGIMLDGHHSYKALLAENDGLATNILSDRLKHLESRGLIARERDPKDARQYIYRATELAISTIPMLVEIMIWGSRHGQGKVSRSLSQRFKKDRQGLIDELTARAMRYAKL